MLESLAPARSRAVLALPAVAAVVLVLTVVAQVSGSANPGDEVSREPTWIFGLTAFVHAAVAAGVIRRGRGTRMGPLLFGLAWFWILATVAHGLIRLPEIGDGLADGAQGWEVVLLWAAKLTSAPVSIGSLTVVACFPSGRLVSGRARWIGIAAFVPLGVSELGIQMTRTPLSITADPKTDVSSPALDATVLPGAHLVPALGTLITIGYLGAVLIAVTVVVRYRRSTGVERDQLRWMVWGVAAVAFLVVGFRFVFQPGQLTTFGITLVFNAIVVSVGVALVNPSLVSIEDLLSRTLVYGGLSVAIILVDLVALSALTEVVGSRLGQRQVVLVVLLVSAVLYNPVRAQIWRLVRRLVLGERDDPYDVVAGLATSLESAVGTREQLEAVARAVATAFGIGYVSVEVARPGGRWLVASHGPPPAETRTLPIAYRGAEVGRLVLPARGVRGRLSQSDQRLLGDLVRQAATAARTGLLAEELQDNRQRLVVAREEERRRIRNDLYEDLGPSVGGLVNQVEAARLLVAEHPDRAKEKIRATSRQLRDVVADLRHVVHDLRPPALDDLGLVGALRQQANLHDDELLHLTVHGDLEGLPAGVEVAAFRIASELVAGCAERGEQCDLVLRSAGNELVLEAGRASGLADHLDAARRRAVEIGGRCEVDGSGTVVISLPLRRAA